VQALVREVVDLLMASGTQEKATFVLKRPWEANCGKPTAGSQLREAQAGEVRGWDPRLNAAGKSETDASPRLFCATFQPIWSAAIRRRFLSAFCLPQRGTGDPRPHPVRPGGESGWIAKRSSPARRLIFPPTIPTESYVAGVDSRVSWAIPTTSDTCRAAADFPPKAPA
jgi:hypothetical protein